MQFIAEVGTSQAQSSNFEYVDATDDLKYFNKGLFMLRSLYYLYRHRENVWKSRIELEEIQNEKLRMLVKHAYQNVKFYREVFDKRGIKPEDIKTAGDITKLPIVKKTDIQHRAADFIAKNYDIRKCKKTCTSGSTGLPLTVYIDPRGEFLDKAVNLRAMMENGMKFTDRFMEITNPENFAKKTWYQMARIFRKERLSVYDSVETNVKKFIEYAPDIFIGYPSIFILMANYITQNNLKIKPPKKIFTTAEVLFDADRAKIKITFDCDVIDMYGCTELRRLAWECSMHEGYHTDIDCAVVEIVKDDILDTEDGNVVVTGLHNYAMPLIRYQTGDIARTSQHACSCGRGFPLIKHIKGRTDDMVMLPSGKIISPRCINILDYIEGIDRYRIIQEEKGQFLVQIERSKQFSEKTGDTIREQIRKGCLNEDVTIKIKEVKNIPQEKSGKTRTVISKIGKIER